MTAAFSVDMERLRSRRTVKWTLYVPDVLAAWVAEMDFASRRRCERRSSTQSSGKTSATSKPTSRRAVV
jgi:bifunctional pyridoxal-dependent enzyme with beta-cystathionase and maltose regulon repressor activities